MFNYAPPHFPNIPVSYEDPVLYSPREELSEKGRAVFENLKPLNVLIPKFFSDEFMYMYIAFPDDDLYYTYPAHTQFVEFWAFTRPWYSGAVERNGDIYITEPYQDAFTGEWIITISRAIYKPDGTLRGVFGVDYFGSYFYSDIAMATILDTGFAVMVSNGGPVVS